MLIYQDLSQIDYCILQKYFLPNTCLCWASHSIWLHFSFGNMVSLSQDQFMYFWTLQTLHWLAFNCLYVLHLFAGLASKFNQLCVPKVEKTQQISAASVISPVSRVAERLRSTSLCPGSMSLLKHTLKVQQLLGHMVQNMCRQIISNCHGL